MRRFGGPLLPFCPPHRTSRTTEVLLLHKHQDRLNPSRQSVSKSVSQPLSQLAGQSQKSHRQFSVSPLSVLTRKATHITFNLLKAAVGVGGGEEGSWCLLFIPTFFSTHSSRPMQTSFPCLLFSVKKFSSDCPCWWWCLSVCACLWGWC